jgi:hypothetical protein
MYISMYTKKSEEKGKKMNAQEQYKQNVTGYICVFPVLTVTYAHSQE